MGVLSFVLQRGFSAELGSWEENSRPLHPDLTEAWLEGVMSRTGWSQDL